MVPKLWPYLMRKWLPLHSRMTAARVRKMVPDAATVLDVGAHNGTLMDALRSRGVECAGVDIKPRRPDVVQGDAARLPFADDIFDLVVSVNTLEHLKDRPGALREFRRVANRLYLGWTPWFSPYGGHEFSPWHLFGRTKGYTHELGVNLFVTTIDAAVAELRDAGWVVEDIHPRYWPWFGFLAWLPGRLADFCCWNVEIMAHRPEAAAEQTAGWQVKDLRPGVLGWVLLVELALVAMVLYATRELF